jgi:hypothetical protein
MRAMDVMTTEVITVDPDTAGRADTDTRVRMSI